MDFWVFAVAAGAGCITNYLKSSSSNKDVSSDVASMRDPESQKYPFRRLECHKKEDRDLSMGRLGYSDIESSNISSAAKEASTSGLDGPKSVRNLEECYVLSPSVSGTEISPDRTNSRGDDECSADCNICSSSNDFLAEGLEGDVITYRGLARKKCSLRSRYTPRQFAKPMTSLESCLMAQLYNHHAELEDNLRSSLQSSASPAVRPLLVTDGRHIISRPSDSSSKGHYRTEANHLQRKAYPEKNRTVVGVPPLPKVGSSQFGKQKQTKSGNGKMSGSCSSTFKGKKFSSRQGSSHGTILFCLGIAAGIIYSIIDNKREVDRLNELLKQTENLVQDLHEELEMKDSLTVKELASENYESQDTHNDSLRDTAPTPFSPENSLFDPRIFSKESYNPKGGETPDSISKIEAELEAELERLGLNVKASKLERRFSSTELNDLGVGFAKGQLRSQAADAQTLVEGDADNGSSSTSTTRSGNYAVSPRELTLRLHEVIQSRLEERIQELEVALESSQRKVQLLESAHKSYRNQKLLDDLEPRSLHSTPVEEFDRAVMPQPLIMTLSGEALSAYDEAYEELVKFDSSEDDSPTGLYETHQQGSKVITEDEYCGQISEANRFTQKPTHPVAFFSREVKEMNGQSPRFPGNHSLALVGDDYGDDEKLLIKQIVEKTKKGSPSVMKVQRLLFSVEEEDD